MSARRLPAPLHPGAVRGEPITLLVDGARVPAFAGEPVAAALLAEGRPVLSRSFRFHRPRGLMCSTGQCGWCECRIDGRPSVRSCRVDAIDGLIVEGEHAWPSVRRDLLGGLDRGSRWIAPTFYHHRFLRPRRLRKRYLDVIRWFGGRGRLRTDTPPPALAREARIIDADVAVVGGGPAGLTAAGAAAEAGAWVVVIEAEPELGGPWRWREDGLPDGGGLPELLDRLAADPRVTLLTATTVASIDASGVHAVAPATLIDVQARAVVVATGSYERLPTVRGNDRPGVIGARTVEWLVRRHGIVPGERAILVGTSSDLDRAGAALRAAGAHVEAIADAGSLIAIDGARHVTGVRIRMGDAVVRRTADLVVVGERVPAMELALSARAAGSSDGSGGPDASGGPAALLAGAAAGRPIAVAADLDAAALVGRAAATGGPELLDAGAFHAGAVDAPIPGPTSLPARAMVCFCEDVRVDDLVRERRTGYGDPELLKRRSGALTGPCQGKYCAPAFCAVAGVDVRRALPTMRPPARPIRLGDLVPLDDGDPERVGTRA